MISNDEAERLAERVTRLSTHSAGEVWTEPDDRVFGGPPLVVMPREIWLEKRAAVLARAISDYISFGFIKGDRHERIQKWIDELQDIWQLVDRDGRIL